ncbi:unnamed protein product [Linum tenue]|uniref:MADS-box domain-containing protein n=1 Tax=Linum tenue TaxID=586396 RepID=A0AAV0JVD2_9ROSI|nr:unnamed protein product [Linum tenue]
MTIPAAADRSPAKKNNQKATKGRQKIPIRKIEEKSQLQVTFSKRRKGLFRKATELGLLYGAHVAVIAFSPGGKVFPCGYPDADSVLRRYAGGGGGRGAFWWEEEKVEEMGLEELEEFVGAVEKVRENVMNRITRLHV